MTRHGIERLPVVDEKDRLIDIVSRRAMLQVFLCSAEEIW
jgi:CBS domain-containing protein